MTGIRPLWRVPLVAAISGLACRGLDYILGFCWARIQIAQGRDTITGAYLSEIIALLAFLLFWVAGVFLLRGLSRREIFFSATLVVVYGVFMLAAEQISQAVGSYATWIYYLSLPLETHYWLSRLLFLLTGEVSLPLAIPPLFTPYLYLLLGRKSA